MNSNDLNKCFAEIKNATREQKLVLELSAAKKERDFYLSKVDQSKAISKIGERLKKVVTNALHMSNISFSYTHTCTL